MNTIKELSQEMSEDQLKFLAGCLNHYNKEGILASKDNVKYFTTKEVKRVLKLALKDKNMKEEYKHLAEDILGLV